MSLWNSISRQRPGTEPWLLARAGLLSILVQSLPRPLRFLAVGAVGLSADLAIFTLIFLSGVPPLAARVVSLGAATLITWRFNRAITFDRTGRPQAEEAARYGCVTLIAQGTSYLTFAALVVSGLAPIPQAAILAGAAMGAAIAYTGHRLFTFARRNASAGNTTFAGAYRRLLRR